MPAPAQDAETQDAGGKFKNISHLVPFSKFLFFFFLLFAFLFFYKSSGEQCIMGLLASWLQDVSLKRGGDCCWRKKGGVVFTACLFALFASHQVPFSSNQMGDRLNHTPGRREQSTPLKTKIGRP